MPRLRSRLTSKKNIGGPVEAKKSPKLRSAAGSRAVTAKKKGNDDKLMVNALATLRSPVLRDRTNLTLEPTKVDLLKKGIEGKEAGDAATEKPEVKAVRTRQKKSEETKNLKAASGRARTRGSKVDVEEAVSPRPSTSSDTSGMIAADDKNKVVKKITARNQDIAGKKRPAIRKAILIEKKPEFQVSTRSKKAKTSLPKVSGDKSEYDEEKLSSNEADEDKSADSSPEIADDAPKKVKKKSVVKNKASVLPGKRSTRARNIKEVNKNEDVEEKLSDKADDDKSENSSPETAEDKPEDGEKKSADEEEVSVPPSKRSSRGNTGKKADKPTGKKFFKTQPLKAHLKISPTKKGKLRTTGSRKARRVVVDSRMSASFRLRQTTLKESLANISKKNLRVRLKKSSENSSPSKKVPKKKGPVYKEVLEDNNASKKDNPDKVYEFSYDLNDSQERIRKRKKRTTRKAPVKRLKTAKKTVDKRVKSTVETKLPEKIVPIQPEAPADVSDEPAGNNKLSIKVSAEVYDPPSPEPFFEDEPVPAVEKPARKPIVISCQELSSENRINWTTTPVQPKPAETESLGPRPYSQRPSIQMKTMMDTSLIRRSLSPISKAVPVPFIEDTGSPWRLAPSNSFSRVRNVFQSTPQGKKFSTLLGKASAAENQRLTSNMGKIEEANDENLELPTNAPAENLQANNSKSPRKFGTEISNNNTTPKNQAGISPSKSSRTFGTDLSNSNNSTPAVSPLKKKSNSASPAKKKLRNSNSSVKKLSKSLTSNITRSSASREKTAANASMGAGISVQNPPADETLDKENSAPNCQSPSKTPRQISKSGSSFGSPFKGFPSNKSVQDSSLGSPFKGFPRNKSVQGSSLGSPFKGFPKKLTSGVTEEIPAIETHPETENQPAIEPQSEINIQSAIETHPDFEPQPGPSGLQNKSPPINPLKLKQSNLNRFLNLPEKPTSSRISTPHGIFDDIITSPIEGNINKKPTRSEELSVGNAFGFDDDYESDDANTSDDFGNPPAESAVPKKVPLINVVKTLTVKAVVHDNNEPEGRLVRRFSERVLSKALKSNKNDDEIEKAETEKTENYVKFKSDLIEPAKFLDTFDVSTEVNTEEVNKSVGLFCDTEPVVHFDQPPRYSYKRKRRQRLMSCGDTEEESDEDERKRPTKKKKLSKAEREQNKKLEEWAKMINNSFQEIDHFNLVVE